MVLHTQDRKVKSGREMIDDTILKNGAKDSLDLCDSIKCKFILATMLKEVEMLSPFLPPQPQGISNLLFQRKEKKIQQDHS